jgi:hypothetical protein
MPPGAESHYSAPVFLPAREIGDLVADYPCDRHNARYEGPSHRAYMRVYRNDQILELKLSVCERCLDLLLEPWVEGCLHKPDDGYWRFVDHVDDLETLWAARRSPIEAVNGSRRF